MGTTLMGLTLYLFFNAVEFFRGKILTTEQCSPLLNENGECIGTKITMLINADNTKYPSEKPITNRHRMVTAKVLGKKLNFAPDTQVQLVNPVGKVYGEYRNQLSLTCEDIVAASEKK